MNPYAIRFEQHSQGFDVVLPRLDETYAKFTSTNPEHALRLAFEEMNRFPQDYNTLTWKTLADIPNINGNDRHYDIQTKFSITNQTTSRSLKGEWNMAKPQKQESQAEAGYPPYQNVTIQASANGWGVTGKSPYRDGQENQSHYYTFESFDTMSEWLKVNVPNLDA